MKRCGISIGVLVALVFPLRGQIAGEPAPELPDSLFVFESPHPLVSSPSASSSWGIVLSLSENGFGGGIFYQRSLTARLHWSIEATLSGARNSDEFEVYDPSTGDIFVPGKVNRLFMLPISIELLHRLFGESLDDSFAPLVSAGIAPTLIIATPYEEEFFRSFSHARLFVRPGAHVGIGARLRYGGEHFLAVRLRYYTIPFGGNGLESIRGRPIHNFGGVVLSVRLPF